MEVRAIGWLRAVREQRTITVAVAVTVTVTVTITTWSMALTTAITVSITISSISVTVSGWDFSVGWGRGRRSRRRWRRARTRVRTACLGWNSGLNSRSDCGNWSTRDRNSEGLIHNNSGSAVCRAAIRFSRRNRDGRFDSRSYCGDWRPGH